MINSKVKSNLLWSSGTGIPHDQKQSPLIQKIALRDVQNDNRSLTRNHPENPPVLEGRPISVKVSGTKRHTPECPLSPPLKPSMSNSGVNENLVHARRRFESELGKGKIQDSVDCLQSTSKHSFHKPQQELPRQEAQIRDSNLNCAPVVRPNHLTSTTNFPHGPSIPISLGKLGNGLPVADSNSLKVKLEVCQPIDSKATDDQKRKVRFLLLQKFLKQCDKSNKRDYIQILLKMSPAERSRYAVELETRAIQLTMEEGKQMQRMKALNILGKCGPTNHPLLTTQQP